jgi:hypothetical protein
MAVHSTEKEAILQRWAEHFDVLNRPSSINEEAINRLSQVDMNEYLALPPTSKETIKAIDLLSSGKAPGSDSIPADVYKAGGPGLVEKLTELFLCNVEPEMHSSRLQRCVNNPSIQAEGEPTIMR